MLTVVLLLLQMVLLLVTRMIIVHSGGLAVFTATAVAAVTIGPVLYSVVVLVPAPAIALVMCLAMSPALTLMTAHKKTQAAGILGNDLLDQGELAGTWVSGA